MTADFQSRVRFSPSPPPPVQPKSRSYHSARTGLALDDSRDEYSNLEKNIKEKKKSSNTLLGSLLAIL
jgi:hypothetical protein